MARLRVPPVRVVLVSHFHWDREWYRTFEDFRSRLVGAVDAVLDLCAADPGYRFVLDGQAVVLEDYLEVRPERRAELEAGVRDGRLSVGPWYVQPDSLLPSGEAHVRNLLHGRAVAGGVGPVSQVAYVPDSFGHPAHFPQLFAGFGLAPFVYWRGNGDEIDRLGPVWQWRAPDGTEVLAWHLTDGYFGAAGLDGDPDVAAGRLAEVVERRARDGDPVLLMNGFDHLPPDGHTGPVVEALRRRLGAGVAVRRALLDEAVELLDGDRAGVFEGPLLGGRIANQLPGVWSARLPLKLRNRACETELTGWTEPWAALGAALGLPDERPALRSAWRALLRNQAHDSVGGCSLDRVADQMIARYDTAVELGTTTTRRVLEQLAGRDVTGVVPFTEYHEVAVFNPSPHPRTGLVRVPLDGLPPWKVSLDRFDLHPLTLQGPDAGWVVDGRPARVVPSPDPARVRFLPDTAPLDLEFVATDVPAFGCRRYRVGRGPAAPDAVDDGRDLAVGDVSVRAADDGTLTVSVGGYRYDGLFGLEDQGDRGDSYDFDPVGDAGSPEVTDVRVERAVSPTGVARLRVERVVRVPVGLAPGDEARSEEVVGCRLSLEAVVVPGVPAVDVRCCWTTRPGTTGCGCGSPLVPRSTSSRPPPPSTPPAGPPRRSTGPTGSTRRCGPSPTRAGWRPTGSWSARPASPRARSRRTARCSSPSCVRWPGCPASTCTRGRCQPARRCPSPAARCREPSVPGWSWPPTRRWCRTWSSAFEACSAGLLPCWRRADRSCRSSRRLSCSRPASRPRTATASWSGCSTRATSRSRPAWRSGSTWPTWRSSASTSRPSPNR